VGQNIAKGFALVWILFIFNFFRRGVAPWLVLGFYLFIGLVGFCRVGGLLDGGLTSFGF